MMTTMIGSEIDAGLRVPIPLPYKPFLTSHSGLFVSITGDLGINRE